MYKYGFVVHTFFLDGIASEYEALSAVSTTDWMVKTQLCKLRGIRHVRWTCLFYFIYNTRIAILPRCMFDLTIVIPPPLLRHWVAPLILIWTYSIRYEYALLNINTTVPIILILQFISRVTYSCILYTAYGYSIPWLCTGTIFFVPQLRWLNYYLLSTWYKAGTNVQFMIPDSIEGSHPPISFMRIKYRTRPNDLALNMWNWVLTTIS